MGSVGSRPEVSERGYIYSKKDIREVLLSLDDDEEVVFFKPRFWCQDHGYHWDLYCWKIDDKYQLMYTCYHAAYEKMPIYDLEKAVNAIWDWIKTYKTRKYSILYKPRIY